MANNDKENKIEKFTKEAIGKTLNQFNKEIGMADLVEINKNQDRILNGILSQVNDENTEKTEKSNIITLDNSTDGIVELKEIQGDTNVNVSKIEEMPITHDIGEKEGNVFTLNEIPKGAISIGEIQGNTMVNCNKDDKKELVLMKDLSTQGDNNITLTEGVDGGRVDVALEGNTLVNVSKTKDSTAVTKSYTVENNGNHIALQGEYDGSCRPVITGKTLVNLCTNSPNDFDLQNSDGTNQVRYILSTCYNLTVGKIYTLLITFKNVVNDNNYSYFFRCDDNNNGTAYTLRNGIHKIVFTMGDKTAVDAFDIRIPVGQITQGARGTVSNPIILEGDYTDKVIPDYFEGLKSTFEDNLVTQEMIDNGKEIADNLGKYRVDYKSTREDGTVGSTKTLYLNSPLLEGDTIEEKDGGIYHIHRSKRVVYDGSDDEGWYLNNNQFNTPRVYDTNNTLIACDTIKPTTFVKLDNGTDYGVAFVYYPRVNLPNVDATQGATVEDFKNYLQQNPMTIVYGLANSIYIYELVSTNDELLIPSYANGHLDFGTVVPVEKVEFKSFIEELTYLYANTQYTVQFVSDKAITIDITLGGTKLLAQSIVAGLNRISITTPATLANNKLVIDGVGANIRKVVVTDTDKEFDYFEGMKSVGECEELEIKSSNKNLYNFDWTIINTKDDYGTSNGYMGTIQKLKPNTKYYITVKNDNNIVFDDNYAYAYISGGMYGMIWTVKPNESIYGNYSGKITTDNTGFVYFRASNKGLDFLNKLNQLTFQIEEGKVATDYTPHQSNAQTLTHAPLRSVGGVKDKYVLLNGNWYIERKCWEYTIPQNTVWTKTNMVSNNGKYTRYYFIMDSIITDKLNASNYENFAISELLPFGYSNSWGVCNRNEIQIINNSTELYVQLDKTTIEEVASLMNGSKIIYPLATPQYEPIDYNPLEVYTGTTHITTNSTIPTNITVKNHGFNCLLKPSTTYTVSSNLGLNTVTTPSVLTEDCLRFMDTDTSDVTTMRDVLVLEGDWTTKADLIPSNFSGIESAFEQEYDVEKGKYKVNVKVTNEDKTKENNITFYINEPLRGVGDVKDKVYIQDDKVVVQRNCIVKTVDGSEGGWSLRKDNGNSLTFLLGNDLFADAYRNPPCICNLFIQDMSQGLIKADNSMRITEYSSQQRLYLIPTKEKCSDLQSLKQWLQQNPVTIVYALAEPTYEEVEYSSNRLILDTFNNESFNNSTLFLDTNISPKLSFKPLFEELVYVKSNTKYYIQFNAVGSGEVVINLGGTELTTEIVEGYNCIPITTPSESTNLMTIIGQGITISEVVVSEAICGGYYKGLQSCFEEHMENGKYRILLRGIALDGSKVNGIKLYINEPLRGVEDTKDRLCIKNGKLMVERKCDSVAFDGSDDENWTPIKTNTNTMSFGHKKLGIKNISTLISNIFINANIYSGDLECVWCNDMQNIQIQINQSKLSTQDVVGFKQWLQQNPLIVVYQLAKPTYEEVTNEYGLPIIFEGYENGIVYIDSAVTPTTHIKYTSNNQLATTLAEAEEQNIATQEDINMNVITYMMDIDMMLTDMEMSNDISVMAVRRDNSNENMLDRMSDEDKKVYRDNTVVMLEKMITAKVLDKEDIEGRIDMYYNKNRISKEQYKYLKSLL